MGEVYEWAKRNKKALGVAALGTAAAVAMHVGFNTKAFHGHSIYEWRDSVARFAPYLVTSLSYGKAIEMTAEGKKGKGLTIGERAIAYGLGAAAASGLWETTENLSSIHYVYDLLHRMAESVDTGNYIKSRFRGKGLASFGDAAINIAATEAVSYVTCVAKSLRNSRDYMD